MGNGVDDKAEALDGAAGFAGQGDHQRIFNDHGEVAGEDRVFCDLHGFEAHDFAEAGQFADGNFAQGLGGDVAQGYAGAAGGENELAAFADLFANGALDFALLVGDKRFGGDFPAVGFGGFFQRGAAEVVVEAFGGAVGDGDDAGGYLHKSLNRGLR